MNKNSKSEDDIDLRIVFKGFLKAKWWFVGTFIIILMAGLFIMYLRNPGYGLDSELEANKDQEISAIQPDKTYIGGALLSLSAALIGGLMVVFTVSYSASFRLKTNSSKI